MNIEEYRNKVEEIENENRKDLERFAMEYAMSHNKVKVGDIITDHMGSICVEKISYRSHGIPRCIYHGCCYTKKGNPYKSGEKRWVYQTNLIGELL